MCFMFTKNICQTFTSKGRPIPLLLLKVMSIAAWQVKLYLTWLFLQKLIQMRSFFFEFLMADSCDFPYSSTTLIKCFEKLSAASCI